MASSIIDFGERNRAGFSHELFYITTVLNRAFIRSAFIFTICGMFFVALQWLAIKSAVAKTPASPAGQQPNTNAGDQTGAGQHPLHQVQPIGPQRISPQIAVQRAWRLRPSPEAKNQIIERRSEQIKREDFSRNLERRRYQLRQEHGTSRGRGMP